MKQARMNRRERAEARRKRAARYGLPSLPGLPGLPDDIKNEIAALARVPAPKKPRSYSWQTEAGRARYIRRTATHEAGHAAVAIEFGFLIEEVQAVMFSGYIVCSSSLSDTRAVERWAMMILAGREAQRLYSIKPTLRSDRSDRMKVWSLLFDHFDETEEQRSKRIARLRARTRRLLRQPWMRLRIKNIRAALLASGKLTKDQLDELERRTADAT